ncbi:hypothetical protein DQ238_19265 [Geodermatophilus sp. TF02-6]|nr:hypothetical protein DQ238_19265 [Geodermatophilus sp. TF02-6]
MFLAMAVGVSMEGAFVVAADPAAAAPAGIGEPNRVAEQAAEPVPVSDEGDAEPPAGLPTELLDDPAFTADSPPDSGLADLSAPPPVGDLSGASGPETGYDQTLA